MTNMDGQGDGTFTVPYYEKKSGATDWFPYWHAHAAESRRTVYGGYAFVVRADSEVTVEVDADVFSVDFGHAGWPAAMVAEITLSLSARNGGNNVSGCRLRTDHVRDWYTPYGPLLLYDGNWEARDVREAISLSNMCVQ